MNNFLHRFKYYVIGLTLGSLMVYFTLVRHRDELPAWTPNDRVLQELRLAEKVVAADITLPFPDSLFNARIRASSVRFSESDVHSGPCRTYQLESDVERMRFSICNKQVTLVQYKPR
ncbi:MAG: hypothetical protein K9J06_07585 [Flavobacteriales bacterium]|nr:hypothetical protein [Flavobacteriales bacterium]